MATLSPRGTDATWVTTTNRDTDSANRLAEWQIVPVEPPATSWSLPDPAMAGEGDLVGVGADLQPGTILAAYRSGLFPMPIDGRLAWWSPDPRAILPLDGLKVSRSLRTSMRRYEVRIDTDFDEVVRHCADKRRPGAWISPDVALAYGRLHRLGWAHSVETWSCGRLVGGLYGVAVGGLFAGESMFHTATDASKVALVALVALLRDAGAVLVDVQWQTDHLASLGVVEVTRTEYLHRLARALILPLPDAFS